jgi:hypothetical protein
MVKRADSQGSIQNLGEGKSVTSLEGLEVLDQKIQTKTTGVFAFLTLVFSGKARKDLKTLRIQRLDVAKDLVGQKDVSQETVTKVRQIITREMDRLQSKSPSDKRRDLIGEHNAVAGVFTAEFSDFKINGKSPSDKEFAQALNTDANVNVIVPFGEDGVAVKGLGAYPPKNRGDQPKLKGVGGFGRVCVQDPGNKAVKFIKIDPRRIESTKKEVELLLKMDGSKNVMGGSRATYINDAKGQPVYVCIEMDKATGDLKNHQQGMDQINHLRAVIGAVKGLKQLHDKGILHRDIKPDNILVKMKGNEVVESKLADLGGCITETEVTNRSFFGTIRYLAPEVRQKAIDLKKAKLDGGEPSGENNPGKPADIYSMGLVLKEAFPAEGSPSGVRQIIQKCLESNPQNRITVDEMLVELENCLNVLIFFGSSFSF